MTQTIREGRWRCLSCSLENRGRDTICQSCGSPRGKDVKFYLPGNEPAVTDSRLLTIAKAGPDWTCDHCDGDNRAASTSCTQCGNERSIDDPSKQSTVIPLSTPVPKENPQTRDYTVWIVLVTLAAFILGGGWLSIPVRIEAEAIQKSWERIIQTEDYRTLTEQDWSIPERGRMVSVVSSIHHYNSVLDHYETRTRQVSDYVQVGSRTVVTGSRDLGNGFFEDVTSTEPVYETQYRTETYEDPVYRQEPAYAPYYTYEIERWVPGDVIKTADVSETPKWAVFNPTPRHRESKRVGKYTVRFRPLNSKDPFDYTTDKEAEWRTYRLKKNYAVFRNRFGTVLRIEPL